MKSLARHLYIVVHSIEPNGLGALCVAALAALMIGLLGIRQLAPAIIRRWAVRFQCGVDDSTTPDQGT